MATDSVVRVIRSEAARAQAERIASLDYPRKRAVSVRVSAHIGQPFTVSLTTADGDHSASVQGFVVEKARTKPVSTEELREHVGRMGSSPFEPIRFDIDLDAECGMSFSAVHGVRTAACTALEERILAGYQAREKSTAPLSRRAAEKERDAAAKVPSLPLSDRASAQARAKDAEICALVTSPEQARIARAAGASRLYASADALNQGTWSDDMLARMVPWLDEVCRGADHPRLDAWIRTGAPVAVGNISELACALDCHAMAEIRECIPLHNDYAVSALVNSGACGVWLNSELTLAEIAHIAENASVPVGYLVSGRIRTMTSEHCVLMATGKCIHDCDTCKLRQEPHYLRGIDNDYLPVTTDTQGRSRIWAPQPFDAAPELDVLLAHGVTRLMVDATLLTKEQTKHAVARVASAVAAVKQGRALPGRLEGATQGHLFSPIG